MRGRPDEVRQLVHDVAKADGYGTEIWFNNELDRRLAAARDTNPNKRREESLQRELTLIKKGKDRLMTAYQEDLLSLDELRQRMPDLRRREQAHLAELQSIQDQLTSRTAYLHLAETLTSFLGKLRSAARAIDTSERQRIVRLLVKDILVGDDTIVIRHSIPIAHNPPNKMDRSSSRSSAPATDCRSYPLRTGSNYPALRRAAGPFDLHTGERLGHGLGGRGQRIGLRGAP